MTKTKKRITTFILAVVMAFTMMPMMGAVSHDNTAKAASGNVPEKVTGLKVAKKSDRWVTLKWNKTPGAKKYIVKQINLKLLLNNPKDVKVKDESWTGGYYYVPGPNGWLEKKTKNFTTTSTKITIKNLKCRWRYRFKVVAVNNNGDREYSDKIEVHTKFFGYNKKEKKMAKKLDVIENPKAVSGQDVEYTVKWKKYPSMYAYVEVWFRKKGAKKWKFGTAGYRNPTYFENKDSYTAGFWCGEYSHTYTQMKVRMVQDNIKGPWSKILESNHKPYDTFGPSSEYSSVIAWNKGYYPR